MSKRLTDISIRNLKPRATRREVPDGNGLYVIVQPSGKKSYAVRYRYAGKPRKVTFPGTLTLKAARKAAADAIYELERGHDPSASRRRQKVTQRIAAANTFKAVAEEYLKREGGRLRSGAWRRAILERLVYDTLGDRPIAEIKKSDVIGLLDQIEAGELKRDGRPIVGGSVMADRTLAVVRKIMRWHATRADDFRSPIVPGLARVKPGERARFRTLTDHELRAVWKTAVAEHGPFPALVRFLLLTAARRTEAAAMTEAELVGADWVLPASRNKTKVDLVRPLSQAAQALLQAQPRIGDCAYFFTTSGKAPISGFSKFKRNFDVASGVTKWSLHDLRRTARSLMSRAGVNADHAERCLGHVIGGVRGTYDRHEYYEEKRHAFEALAVQIDRIVNPVENVVPMRG